MLRRSRRCVSASDGDSSVNLTVRPPDRHPRLWCVLPTDRCVLSDHPTVHPRVRPNACPTVAHVCPSRTSIQRTNSVRPTERPPDRPSPAPPSHTSIRSFGRLAVRPFVGPSVRPTDRPSARLVRPTVTMLPVGWSARPSRTCDRPTVRPFVETTVRCPTDRRRLIRSTDRRLSKRHARLNVWPSSCSTHRSSAVHQSSCPTVHPPDCRSVRPIVQPPRTRCIPRRRLLWIFVQEVVAYRHINSK